MCVKPITNQATCTVQSWKAATRLVIDLRMHSRNGRSLLLLSLGGSGLDGGGSNSNRGLVVLGDGKALAVGGETEEGLSALAADEAIGVLSHVGGRGALGALLLELLDLAGSLNGEVFEESLGALLVLVGDSLGGGVHLLLALTLSSLGVNHSGNSALLGEASFLKGELLSELGSASDETVNSVFGGLFDLFSTKLR